MKKLWLMATCILVSVSAYAQSTAGSAKDRPTPIYNKPVEASPTVSMPVKAEPIRPYPVESIGGNGRNQQYENSYWHYRNRDSTDNQRWH